MTATNMCSNFGNFSLSPPSPPPPPPSRSNIYFSQILCTFLQLISNFVSSNYFLNFSRATPGNSASLIYKNGCLFVCLCECVLPIGAQTAKINGMKIGMGTGMDR